MAKQEGVYTILSRTVEGYSDELKDVIFKAMSKSMKMAKKDLVAKSPGGGEYAKGWAIRTKRYKYGYDGIVYNRDKPSLTHLLEKSHVIKNQYGQYSRTSPGNGQVIHIAPIAEAAEQYYVDNCMEEMAKINGRDL